MQYPLLAGISLKPSLSCFTLCNSLPMFLEMSWEEANILAKNFPWSTK